MTVHRTKRSTSLLAAALVALALAWMHLPATATAAGCANETSRAEQGAAALALPDCRAYELVSRGSTPLVDSSGIVPFGVRAADDGNAIAYFSYYPLQDSSSSGFFFRARRGAAGWTPEAMSPPMLPGASTTHVICDDADVDYSENLLASVLRIGRDIKEEFPGSSFCPQPQNELVPGEPRGFANLLRRATPDSPYELVNQTPAGVSAANAQVQDTSDDLSHIAFGEEAQLTPEAPPGYNLYLWAGGTVRLVTFLPDGTPVRGDLAGATEHLTSKVGAGGTFNGMAPITHALSSNGERVFFYANGNLYLRENAAQLPAANPACGSNSTLACTRQIDRSLGEGPSGAGVFQYASADGSRVFFTDESKLTTPASASAGKPALYEYNVESHTLADRTPGATGADVRGFSGAAKDGSRLYFVAKAALTGAQKNGQAETAQAGQPNLYLLENGALTFVATLDPASDRSAWSFELTPKGGEAPTGGAATLATRTSPDGRYFAFNSTRGLTGGTAGTRQIFVYDAVSGSLSCASCPPGGGAPPGPSEIPAPIATTEVRAPVYLPRGLTDSGQLFFTTTQTLLPTDRDGVADVYEYRQGALQLISNGVSAGPSYFFDASDGADDIFFGTSDALVRSDTDNALNLYDARVDGGFVEPPAPAPPCATGEPCRSGGSGAPPTGTPATPSQAGAGNVVPPKRCKRGKVRRKGHCVKKAKHRKDRKHHTSKKGTRR